MSIDTQSTENRNWHHQVAEYMRILYDVNENDSQGNAAIHKAARKCDIEEAQSLLDLGADIDLGNREGATALQIAVDNLRDCRHDSLEREFTTEILHFITFLLARNANPNKGRWGVTPLRWAVRIPSLEAVRLLLPVTEKKDLKKRLGFNQIEITIPWFIPLLFDDFESVSEAEEWIDILLLLKANGANLNAIHEYANGTMVGSGTVQVHIDETILYRFVRSMQCRLNRISLKEPTERFGNMFTQLALLLKNGADPTIACGEYKQTVLHIFIEEVNASFIEGATEQVLSLFLEHGVKINTPDENGNTPLHAAALAGNTIAASFLLSKGADIAVKNRCGHSPLHLSAAGHPEITEDLIASGADVKALDVEGLTPYRYSLKIEEERRGANPRKLIDNNYEEARRLLRYADGWD